MKKECRNCRRQKNCNGMDRARNLPCNDYEQQENVCRKIIRWLWVVCAAGIASSCGGIECNTMTLKEGLLAMAVYTVIIIASYMVYIIAKPRPKTKAMRKRARMQRRRKNQTSIDDALSIAGVLGAILLVTVCTTTYFYWKWRSNIYWDML